MKLAMHVSLTQTPLCAPRLALHSQPTHSAESMLSEIPYSSRRERDNRIATRVLRYEMDASAALNVALGRMDAEVFAKSGW